MDKLISVKIAAQMLGCSRSSFHVWDHNGTLKPDYITPGGHRRYSLARMEAMRMNMVATDIKPQAKIGEVQG